MYNIYSKERRDKNEKTTKSNKNPVTAKTRTVWTINPVTKVIPDKTKYSRKTKYKKAYE